MNENQQFSIRRRNMDSNLSQYSNIFTKIRKQSQQNQIESKEQTREKKTAINDSNTMKLQTSKNYDDEQLKSNYMYTCKTEVEIKIPIPINIILVGNGLPRISNEDRKSKHKISTKNSIRAIFQSQFKKTQISTDQIIKSLFASQKQQKKDKIIPKPLMQKHLRISNIQIDLNIIMSLSPQQIKNNEYSYHIATWNNLQSPKIFIFFVHNTNFDDLKYIHNFISNISCQNIQRVKNTKQSIKQSTVSENKIYKQISGMLIVDNTQYQLKDKDMDIDENKILKQQQYIQFASQYNLLYLQTTTQEQKVKKCNQWFAFIVLLKFSQFGLQQKIRYYTDKIEKGLREYGINTGQLDNVQLSELHYKQNKVLEIYQSLSRQVGLVKQKIIHKLGQIYGAMCQLSRSLKQINNQITKQLNKYNGYQSVFKANKQKKNERMNKQTNNGYKQLSTIYYEEQKEISQKIERIIDQKIKIIKHMKILQTIENNINTFKLGDNNPAASPIHSQRNSYTKMLKTIRQSQRNVNNHTNKQMQVFNKIQNIEQYYIKILLTTFSYSNNQLQSDQKSDFNSSNISKQTRSTTIDKQFIMNMQNIFRGDIDLINVYEYQKTRSYMQKILGYLTQKQQQIKNLKNTLYIQYCKRNKIVTQLWQNLQSYTTTLQQILQKIKNNSQIQKQVDQGQRNQIQKTILEMIEKTKAYLSDIMQEKQQIRWEINTYISVFDKIQHIIGYDFGIVEELTNRWDNRYSGKNFVRTNAIYSDQVKKVDEKNQLFEEYLIQFFLNKLTEQLQIVLNKSIKSTNYEIQKPNISKSSQNTQKSQGYLLKLSQKYKQFAEYIHNLSLQFNKKQDTNKDKIKQINKRLLVDIHNYQAIKKADSSRIQELIYIIKQNENKNKQLLMKKQKKQKKLKNKKSKHDVEDMNAIFSSCLKNQLSDKKNQQNVTALNKPLTEMTFGVEKQKIFPNTYAVMNNYSIIPQSYTWQQMDFQKSQVQLNTFIKQNQNSNKSQNQQGQTIMREQIQLDFNLLLENQNIQ